MAAHQAPPSLGFSRQEQWSGLPFPSPMHESEKWKWICSVVSNSSRPPWTAAHQAPPSMGFSRQEYWSGVPLLSPMTNLDSILKSRDITLPTNVRLVKAMVFPVVIYGWESWTIKKAEHQRIDAFELFCWRRLLRVPWTARRSNQWILKEISPECSWKDWCWSCNSNTLGTWWEELSHWKRPWCWKGLKAGGDRGDRVWDGWMASPTQWTWVWVNSGSWWWIRRPGVLLSMGLQRVGHDWVTEVNWEPGVRIKKSEDKSSFLSLSDYYKAPGFPSSSSTCFI